MCLLKSCAAYLKIKGWLRPVENDFPMYWWSGVGNRNFGDVVGPYLVEKITDKKPLLVTKKYRYTYYLTVGSILKYSSKNAIIWGSGIISRGQNIKKPKATYAVRGPLSRDRLLELGYECPEVYGDPALLLPRFYQPTKTQDKELGIIPHFVDFENISAGMSQLLFKDEERSIKLINLLDPIEKVIDDIASCKRIVSSSLHGLITAHTYGIPALWVCFSDQIKGDNVKYHDYFLSVGITPYEAYDLKTICYDLDEIIQLIDAQYSQKIMIDLDKLYAACPFVDGDYA